MDGLGAKTPLLVTFSLAPMFATMRGCACTACLSQSCCNVGAPLVAGGEHVTWEKFLDFSRTLLSSEFHRQQISIGICTWTFKSIGTPLKVQVYRIMICSCFMGCYYAFVLLFIFLFLLVVFLCCFGF